MWFKIPVLLVSDSFFSLFLSICPTPALFLPFSMAWLQLSSWPLLYILFKTQPRWATSFLFLPCCFSVSNFVYPLCSLLKDRNMDNCTELCTKIAQMLCLLKKRRIYSSLLSFKIVGNLLYYRYMNPAIVAPDAFDIIDMSAGGQLTTEQRRNLGSIAKMLQHAASNKMFLGDNAHLNPINEYLSNSYQKFRYKWHQVFVISSSFFISILMQVLFYLPDVSFCLLVTSHLWKTSSMWINTLTWSPWPSLWSIFPLGRSSTLTR